MKINKLLATVLVVSSFVCSCSEKAKASQVTVSQGESTELSSQEYKNITDDSGNGAVISNSGTLKILSSTFSSNQVTSTAEYQGFGGAIINFGNLTLDDVTFTGNTAYRSGGAIETEQANVTITSGKFENNTATNSIGGAINQYMGTLNVSNTEFTSNKATNGSGGAILSCLGTFTSSGNTYTSNEAIWGGAIYNENTSTKITGDTYTSNQAEYGGAIYNDSNSTLKISSTTFTYNKAEIQNNGWGGAIINLGDLTLDNVTFDTNTAYYSGGALETEQADVTITSGKFYNNIATKASGGAIFNWEGNLNISGTEFDSNKAENDSGGAILNYNGTLTSSGNTYTSNKANWGGAIYNEYNANTQISNDSFTGNTASYGGAVHNDSSTLNISNGSTFTSNISTNAGGAIYNNIGSLTISDTQFKENQSVWGGAIYDVKGTTVIKNSIFTSNKAVSDVSNTAVGGAICINIDANHEGSVSIYNSEFTENTADAGAGAIANYGVLNLYNSTFTSNSSSYTGTNVDTGGGALFLGADSVTYISNTTFNKNTSGSYGGVISTRTGNASGNNSDAKLDILNSTFTNNTAVQNGGAIYNTFYGSTLHDGYVTVSGSTFTNNSAASGGAIYNSEVADLAGNYAKIYIDSSTFTSNKATSGNGGAFYNSANTTAVINNSSFYSNSATGNGGAIYTAADLTINSTNGYQTVFSGNSAASGNAIYVDNSEANINFNLFGSSSVLLEDDINGLTGYNVNISGDSTSTTFYLYNDISEADVTIGNTTLNTLNSEVHTYDFNSFTLASSINMAVDVDLASETMDKLTADSYGSHSGTLTVSSMNALSDTTKDSVAIYFAQNGLKGNVANGVSSLYAPIYKYTVSYEQRDDGGYFVFSKDGYNPSVLASSVAAQLGGYLTQLNSYDEAFRNMDMYMLMTKKQRQALKMQNKYAAADSSLVFSPLSTPYTDKAGWIRPYTTFESVGLKNGPDVSNVAYGMYGGLESEMYDLGNGWDGIYSIYAGYNGSHQAYQGNSIYQNGGTLGIVGMAYKDNFFTGLTVNAGANAGQANTMYGNEDFSMLLTGIASKSGYNYEFADGRFIVQPNFLMSYSFVNTFDYTNAAGVRINSDPLHAIQLEPGLKVIGNLENGWQPYAGVSVVWNIMDKTQFKANDASLPELSVKPFVKYGVGIRKTWGKRFFGYLQTFLTNGGRNGIGIQAGFRWTLGKDPSKYTNSTGEKKYIKAKA
ncbi:MAG: hypothetical protein LUG16_01305 [Candidatus Gastranaerophilales bacterium]|nr:hypothetical protein [Candidatus Gastranaerophilales bacterium]